MEESATAIMFQKLANSNDPNEVWKYIQKETNIQDDKSFPDYFNEYMSKHPDLTIAQIIKNSDVPRTYGYEIVNGRKKASRDRLIAICYAAKMTPDECNHALIYSEHAPLYAKNKRDACIIFAFKNNQKSHTASIVTLNDFLTNSGHDPLVVSKDI